MPALPVPADQIVITASRAPEAVAQTAASVTIFDQQQIDRLGEPLIPAIIRLSPSTAVATSGPLGALTDVRIRGSEANHTLLFIDGIRANDPAAGDAPRFELLNGDLVSRIEVLRGPQSALWGSDAIGGVIAVNGVDDTRQSRASAEAGSFGFVRASASTTAAFGKAQVGGGIGWQRSAGIDSFGVPGGDKDGYRNLSGRLRATFALNDTIRVGASGFLLTGRSEFDGYSPITFERTDTLDNTRNRLGAARLWTEFGSPTSAWSGHVGVSLLESSNRNYLANDALNRTRGSRRTFEAQVARTFSTGPIEHDLIVAAETEHESFHARGFNSGLSTDQDRTRNHEGLTAEWRARLQPITADVALRRDIFNRFKDTTSLRASLLAELGGGFAVAGSYAEGIAQPTFFDLYGTFPNIFFGNPNLKAEASRGFEGSLRFRRGKLNAALTAYRQRLHGEIVDVFDLTTFQASTVNTPHASRRWGAEAELGWRPSPAFGLTANYTFTDATQPDILTGIQFRERRRPKHLAALTADGLAGHWRYGGSISYASSHLDATEVAPFGIVRVKPYWLADARIGYALRKKVELFVRGSNLFDSAYEEVAGYKTEGRGLFAGVRLISGR